MAKAPKPAAAPAAAAKADQGYRVPDEFRGKPGLHLLMRACNLLGIDPDPTLPVFNPKRHKPEAGAAFRELMDWRFYRGDRSAGDPDYVTLVTAGGLKITHRDDMAQPWDDETDHRLALAFNAFRINRETKLPERIALPADLTLPANAVLGFSDETRHQYRRGYLREGGRAEADRREAAEAAQRAADAGDVDTGDDKDDTGQQEQQPAS